MHPKDRHFQVILCRSDPLKPIEFGVLNTMTYGEAPSPYLADWSSRELASIYRTLFPKAFKIIFKKRYVDDFTSGADTRKLWRSKRS